MKKMCVMMALILSMAWLAMRPAKAAQSEPAKAPAAAQPADVEKPPAGAPDLPALGKALCAAGQGTDIKALFALFEPVMFDAQMSMIREFLKSMAEENGEPVQDPLEGAIKEFEIQAKENPLVVCRIEKTAAEECSEQILQSYKDLNAAPQACGSVTMTSKMKNDEKEITEPVPAVQFNGRWFLFPAM